jgi:extracellular factor (EF) 3-hydroxypalmitic acid methyl ester biosynthesis protein
MKRWQRVYHIQPEFKLVVADLQMLLLHMRQWLEQVELAVRAQPAGDRLALEQRVVSALREPALESLAILFQRFEDACIAVPQEQRPVYAAYVKRQLHSIVLCAPFMYRTFHKPLGYAGDYEMVNMMTRDSQEGGSLFAKVLNSFFLETPPVVAHRNRLKLLTEKLVGEAARLHDQGTALRALTIGSGPALEVQEFLRQTHLSDRASFALLDFNNETLTHASDMLERLKSQHHRATTVHLLKMSIAQFIKEASKPTSALKSSRYNFIYCAGLFDYLPQHVCRMLLKISYQMLTPGGLMLATNVDQSNPNRGWMELSVDWHLIYRNHESMRDLAPAEVAPEDVVITSDASGVNVLMEVRKPAHG